MKENNIITNSPKRIVNRYNELYYRLKPIVQTKFEKTNTIANHLTKEKTKKLYKYYICDYCGAEIKIDKKRDGIVILPRTLTKKDPLKLALCNRCINAVVAEFEEEYK